MCFSSCGRNRQRWKKAGRWPYRAWVTGSACASCRSLRCTLTQTAAEEAECRVPQRKTVRVFEVVVNTLLIFFKKEKRVDIVLLPAWLYRNSSGVVD